MDNLTRLTAGNKIYAKKRKHKIEQIPEVVFDETARRDFLTGFHKRKLERKAKAKENALQFSKQERAKARKAARESLKAQVNERLAKLQEAINRRNGIVGQTDDKESEKEEEINDNDDENNNQESNVIQKEFILDVNTKTTVTIIEDLDTSNIFENVSKKPRIEEIDHNKEISPVPTEQKSTSVNKNSKNGNKKKYQPRNKTRRSKTKKIIRSKSKRNKRK